MRKIICIAMLPLLGAAAPATDAPRQLSLTVYNSNLALVQDKRTLDVAAGRSRLEFADVSAAIRPETASLSGDGLSIVEQNFDYDLLTPSKMMEKAVGKQIQIVRIIPGTGKETTETATVLSVNDGVILKIGNRIEVLRDDGMPTRVIFNGIPENLRARPTLSVTVEAKDAGPRDATLSYLTTGLSWKADYVALFDEKKSVLNLQGWVTLTNNSGTSFENARTRLVAGNVNLIGTPPQNDDDSTATQTAGTVSSSAADYRLYTLPERLTIAESQTKQVSFLSSDTGAHKIYEFRADGFSSQENPQSAQVALDFSNRTNALPAGIIRVYERDESGAPKFIGENRVGHTPAGSDLSIVTGEAFDILVQPTIVSSERLSRRAMRYAMSYTLTNAGSSPVTVELRQGGLGQNGTVNSESLPSKHIDAYTLGWRVPIPANGKTVLTFSVDTDR
jgi:hypothetical protein